MFRILNFSICAPIEYLTGIDERRKYNCEMQQREIPWPILIVLHYDEFKAMATGIFSLYQKKV
jgi:hypothetical protein